MARKQSLLMNYPLISEYVDAIKAAEDNFDQLKHLRPVLGEDGEPVMTSGNFAVVFKMSDERDGKCYAVKCFTKEQEGRAEAYREITKELENVLSPYLTSVRYFDNELFVDSNQTSETEFPVLQMDWVEGKTLDKYLRENLDDQYALEMLAYRFSQLAQWLIPQPFAHGDLKPDNILVKDDGSLVLVDYDGMYVPAMKGQKAREIGSPDFRHPLRTENDFDENIDVFPLVSVILSFKAISINPLLFEEFGGSQRLLLSETDYRDISESTIMHNFIYYLSNRDFALTYSLFITALTHIEAIDRVKIAFIDLCREQHLSIISDIYCKTRVDNNDSKGCIEDEQELKYSRDWKKLIKGGRWNAPYTIHKYTDTICDDAFSGECYWDGSGWNNIGRIVIPANVKYIGRNPFTFCFANIICESPNFIIEHNALYTADKILLIGFYGYEEDSFEVPKGVKYIGDYAFAGSNLKTIKVSSTVEVIGDYAFLRCQVLETIVMSDHLKQIGRGAFSYCEKINNIVLPKGLISIGSFAFSCCHLLEEIIIPATVLYVGTNPFLYDHLTMYSEAYLFEVDNNTLYTKGKKYLISCLSSDSSFQIPKEVTHIGQNSFYGCRFRKLYLHRNVEYIGKDAFDGCFYETDSEYGFGYIMDIYVPKGRYNWAKNRITKRIDIKEVEIE